MPTKTRATKAKQTTPAKTIILTPDEVISAWLAYFQLRRWIHTHQAILRKLDAMTAEPALSHNRRKRPKITPKSGALEASVQLALWVNHWADEEAAQYHRFQRTGNGKR